MRRSVTGVFYPRRLSGFAAGCNRTPVTEPSLSLCVQQYNLQGLSNCFSNNCFYFTCVCLSFFLSGTCKHISIIIIIVILAVNNVIGNRRESFNFFFFQGKNKTWKEIVTLLELKVSLEVCGVQLTKMLHLFSYVYIFISFPKTLKT